MPHNNHSNSNKIYGDYEFERRFYCEKAPNIEDIVPSSLLIQSYYVVKDGYNLRVRISSSSVLPQMSSEISVIDILENNPDAFNYAACAVKGPMNMGTRYEAEYEIDPIAGVNLIKAGGHHIIKIRRNAWVGQDAWVIDYFGGNNYPLIIAECERQEPVVDLQIPSFCTSEITADYRFTNSELSVQPFCNWANQYLAQLAAEKPVFLEDFGTNDFVD